jgi:TPR repeat protein
MAFETKEKRKKWDDIFPLWYSAATSGHVRAQFYLATCYDDGFGTKKHLRLAFEWYLKAARAGHSDS